MQISRRIAANAIPEIVDGVIHIISQNPELAERVRNQISQQSLGLPKRQPKDKHVEPDCPFRRIPEKY